MSADSLALDTLTPILNEGLERIRSGDGVGAIRYLCGELARCRELAGEMAWRETWCPACRIHPLRDIAHQDPYTWRAFAKPRGYAGDAVMLDYVYSGQPPAETSPLGQVVFAGTTRTSNGLSVVDRRDRLAAWIDEEARRQPAAHVMSIACGHLREAELSTACAEGTVARFYAFDQDAESLAEVSRVRHRAEVQTIHAPLTQLLRGSVPVEPVDFIYAAGLFDYLSDRLATRTLQRMFDLLRPGGRLIVANFTPRSGGRSYMEAFMDWWLIYRGPAELDQLASVLPADQLRDRHAFTDRWGNIAYLDIRRREKS